MKLYTESVALDELVPAVVNPKLHADTEIVASIVRFGFVEPVLIDERTGRLIAGHGRLDALRSLEAAGADLPKGLVESEDLRWMVPVVRGWSSANDAEAEALLVAVNRLPARGGWDDAMLADVLGQLQSLDGVGFGPADLDDLMAGLQEFVPAEVPAPGEWDTYRNAQVRSMVFDYPLESYVEITAIAARARPVFGVESNAELFAAMLAARL